MSKLATYKKYHQEWRNVIFLHWPIDPKILAPHIPNAIDLQLFEDKAWISLVAFDMVNIRPYFLPSFPWISNFSELNLRTYVTDGTSDGVYFLSIDASNMISCYIARMLSCLPYEYAKMRKNSTEFYSQSKINQSEISFEFSVSDALEKKSELDIWLTERYALFQDNASAIIKYKVVHEEWNLSHIEVKNLAIQNERYGDWLKAAPQFVHYSEGVKVIAIQE